MTTLIYEDPVYALHQVPHGHPERPERMEAVKRALAAEAFAELPRRDAEPAPYEAIAAVHPSSFIERLAAATPEEGLVSLDPDTHVGPDSLRAARTATGAAMAAVDAVARGEAHNAFVASRPPGHHAERTRAMGFCLINHVAIAARHAQSAHGYARVAIVDFDVHHGNGTQDVFYEDQSVLYVSTHQSPLYPGTGAATERGVGNIVNLPMRPGTDGGAYRAAFTEHALPALDDFAPDLVLLSAGFDAHRSDPLGGMALTEDDFSWITEVMLERAARNAGGRLVSVLEGGYDLAALGRCAAAHVATLASA